MSFSTSFDNRDLTNDELGCLRGHIELCQRLGITRTMWVTIACELTLEPYLSVKRMGDEMVQRDPFWNSSISCIEDIIDADSGCFYGDVHSTRVNCLRSLPLDVLAHMVRRIQPNSIVARNISNFGV